MCLRVVLLVSLVLPTQQLASNTALEVRKSKSLLDAFGKILESIYDAVLQLLNGIAGEIDQLKGNLAESEAEQLQETLDYGVAKLLSTAKDLLPTFKRIGIVVKDVYNCVRAGLQTLRSTTATFTSELSQCGGIFVKLVRRFFQVVLKFLLEAREKYEAFLIKFTECKNIYCRFSWISDSLKGAARFVMIFLENGAEVIFELINKFPACISDALYDFTKEIQLAIDNGGKCVANVGGGELIKSEVCKSNIESELREIIHDLINIPVNALVKIALNFLNVYNNFPPEAQQKLGDAIEPIVAVVNAFVASLQSVWKDIQNFIFQIVVCVLKGVQPVQNAVKEAKDQLGICVEVAKGHLGEVVKDLEEPLSEVLLKLFDFFFNCGNNICRIGLLTSLPSLILKITPAFAKIAGKLVDTTFKLLSCAKQQITEVLVIVKDAVEASKTCVLNFGE